MIKELQFLQSIPVVGSDAWERVFRADDGWTISATAQPGCFRLRKGSISFEVGFVGYVTPVVVPDLIPVPEPAPTQPALRKAKR